MTEIAIYFAGSIKKGHEEDSSWNADSIQKLQNTLIPLQVKVLNPAHRKDDLSDQLSVFGRDMYQVFLSDFVIVDAIDRRGLGVGAEMMWAKLHQIPVITLAPKDTHYNKTRTTLLDQEIENFIHPFVENLSDAIVEDLQEAALWIKEFMSSDNLSVKDFSSIQKAMRHYKTTQFKKDEPMQEIIQSCMMLSDRFEKDIKISL